MQRENLTAVTKLETNKPSLGRLSDHLGNHLENFQASSSHPHDQLLEGSFQAEWVPQGVTLPPDQESEPNLSMNIGSHIQQYSSSLKPRVESESSESSISWDNYCDKSSYELGEDAFWLAERDIRKIPIVSTDISELGWTSSESGSDISQTFTVTNTTMVAPSDECSAAAKALAKAKNVLTVRIEMVDPEEVDESFAHTVPEELNCIRDLLTNYIIQVRDFLQVFQAELEATTVTLWEDEIKKTKKIVLDHKKAVWEKYNQIYPVKQISFFEQQTLANQTKQVNLEETRVKSTVDTEEQRIRGVAEVRYDALVSSAKKIIDTLAERSKEVLDEESDDNIKKFMRELKEMKVSVNKFTTDVSQFKELTVLFKLSDEKHQNVNDYTDKIESEFKDYTDNLEEQDTERALYTLDSASSEKVKWPKFSGGLEEDFGKFIDKFNNASKLNKTSKIVQLTKLRECLSGYPLTLVPETTVDVQQAIKVLTQMYGNVSRVLAFQKKKLSELGPFPADIDGTNPRKKMQWLMDIKQIMLEYVRIGDSEDTRMFCEAFSVSSIGQFINAFPPNMVEKLTSVGCDVADGKEQLEALIEKVEEMRLKAQRVDIHNSLNPRLTQAGGKKSNALHGSGKHKKEAADQMVMKMPGKAYVDIMNSNLKTHKSCKICINAKSSDPCVDFSGHLGIWTTGCPIFNAMDTKQRFDVATALDICIRCLNPTKRIIDKKKMICGACKPHKFTCRFKNQTGKCLLHIWTCKSHKYLADNKEVIKEYEKVWKAKTGKTVAMLAQTPSLDTNPPTPQTVDLPIDVAVCDPISQRTVSSIQIQSNPHNLALAARRLKRNTRKRNPSAEILPIPQGQSLFIFCPVEGKTRDLNFFMDCGCSSAIFKTGIPGNELKGQVVEKGPFIIQGVNGVKIVVGDEWLVQVPKTDGKIQLMKGLTLDVVTADFPAISTEKAVLDVKSDLPDCTELQACRVPNLAGGSVDGLIGLLYNSIFPVPIHSLPSGLTIYKSKLKSKDNKFDATIGGPHQTFDHLAGHSGGVAALLTIFRQGLERFHEFGPPKIPAAPLSVEEASFYKQHFLQEEKEFYAELNIIESVENVIIHKYNEDDSIIANHLPPNPVRDLVMCECGKTCNALTNPSIQAHSITEEERIKDLNSLKLQLEEGGLEISYRCVRCRNCPDCKNSAKTEHLTLREEAEMELIKQSVRLDFKNKKIICTLPLRGPEEEFLTSNRDRAVKVLEQQCRKYHKDADTKETVLKAFAKLFDNGHAGPVHELSDDERNAFCGKPVDYYIPWRVVFSDSLTTPCRPVLDGSSRTRLRADGTGGGRCLNDLVAKGKIDTINLVKMLLRFCAGASGFCGDLQQFYNTCKLEPTFWNLQRFLWKPDLDPNANIVEMVMKTLIYGVKSVSAQTEEAKRQLAESIKNKYPEVYDLILNAIYVDDIGDSRKSEAECEQVIKEADDTFSMVSLKVKDWVISGKKPSEKVSKDGLNVGVGGFLWNPFLDGLEIKIPGLHFGKRNRGRLTKNTEVFSGSFEDLEDFVPKLLTRRQVASKYGSVFDILGKFGPIFIGAKKDLRKTFKMTDSWDSPMPQDLRQSWIRQFWKWEQLRGLNFSRAVMPQDAKNPKMRLITAVDMADECINVAIWAGFLRQNGLYSCQHLISRTILASEDCSVPKGELEALTGGSNLCWLVREWLKDWVESYIVTGDSTISLFWVSSEHKKLSLFHRNRVLQILRGSSLDCLYHVKTDQNPSDLGTRPSKVSISDVSPGSKWICGLQWMSGTIENAVSNNILTPVKDLRMKKEEEETFNEGCVFEKIPEVLTKGHMVSEKRVSKLEERAKFSDYLILPTKFRFRKLVRIYSYVFAFSQKLKAAVKKRRPDLFSTDSQCEHRFSMFYIDLVPTQLGNNLIHGNSHLLLDYFGQHQRSVNKMDMFCASQIDTSLSMPVPTDKCINMTLTYLFRKATGEVKNFNKKAKIEKISQECDGILFSSDRYLNGMRFVEIGNFQPGDLQALGVKSKVPVLDRYSPLSYCIAQHVHWSLSAHRGAETCYRESLQHCYIIQGLPLFLELQGECIRCKKIRKRYMQQLMSPLSEHQLTVAPPFWAAQMDLFGPCTLYVPGKERETRRNPVMTYKAWVLVLVCPVTKLANIQVCEKSDASGILDGLTRMFCEAGVPKVLLCDDGSAVVKALREAEIDIRNLEQKLITEYGASFKIVPVSGHNMNGLVERAIRTIQDSLEESGLKSYKLNAVGLQTLCKLVENQFNNFPLGFKYSRDADNSEVFKILTPNQLRHGRNNARSLDGPVRLPGNLSEMAKRVSDVYEAWFKIWSTSAVPKLAHRVKWFHPQGNLEKGDIVYFQKDSSGLDNRWTVGMIEEAVEGTDGFVREVVIRYRNASEDNDRFTNRAARSCVRLHNMDDQNLFDDLHELTRRLKNVNNGEDIINLLHFESHEISDKDCSDPSEQPSSSGNSDSFVSIAGSISEETTRITHGESEAHYPPENWQDQLLTPRSRSPLLHSSNDETSLEDALSNEGLKTPVIVCNEPIDHKALSQNCIPSSGSKSKSSFGSKSKSSSGAKSNSSLPTAITAKSLSSDRRAKDPMRNVLNMPEVHVLTTKVAPTSTASSMAVLHVPTEPIVVASTASNLKDNVMTAKNHCCSKHKKFVDTRMNRGGLAKLAFDLSDMSLIYNDRRPALKYPCQFESLNEMIFSYELEIPSKD